MSHHYELTRVVGLEFTRSQDRATSQWQYPVSTGPNEYHHFWSVGNSACLFIMSGMEATMTKVERDIFFILFHFILFFYESIKLSSISNKNKFLVSWEGIMERLTLIHKHKPWGIEGFFFSFL